MPSSKPATPIRRPKSGRSVVLDGDEIPLTASMELLSPQSSVVQLQTSTSRPRTPLGAKPPDFVRSQRFVTPRSSMDLEASYTKSSVNIFSEDSEDGDDFTTLPPSTPHSVVSGKYEPGSTFFTGLQKSLGERSIMDSFQHQDLDVKSMCSAVNPMQSISSKAWDTDSDNSKEEDDTNYSATDEDDEAVTARSTLSSPSDSENELDDALSIAPDNPMLTPASSVKVSPRSTVRQEHEDDIATLSIDQTTQKSTISLALSASQLFGPQLMADESKDAIDVSNAIEAGDYEKDDGRSETEPSSMTAVHESMEEQRMRRSELESFLHDLKEKTLDDGEKLIELPENYTIMVEEMARLWRNSDWLGPRRFEDLPISQLNKEHADPKVEAGLKAIRELDKKIAEKLLEAMVVERMTFPSKYAQTEEQRMYEHVKQVEALLRKERSKSKRAARLAQALSSIDSSLLGFAHTNTPSLYQKLFKLTPEEEVLVEQVLARPEEYLDLNPFVLDEEKVVSEEKSITLSEINSRLEDYMSEHSWDETGSLCDFRSVTSLQGTADDGTASTKVVSQVGSVPSFHRYPLSVVQSDNQASSKSTSSHVKFDYLRDMRTDRELRARDHEIDARIRAFKIQDPSVRLNPEQLEVVITECRKQHEYAESLAARSEAESQSRQADTLSETGTCTSYASKVSAPTGSLAGSRKPQKNRKETASKAGKQHKAASQQGIETPLQGSQHTATPGGLKPTVTNVEKHLANLDATAVRNSKRRKHMKKPKTTLSAVGHDQVRSDRCKSTVSEPTTTREASCDTDPATLPSSLHRTCKSTGKAALEKLAAISRARSRSDDCGDQTARGGDALSESTRTSQESTKVGAKEGAEVDTTDQCRDIAQQAMHDTGARKGDGCESTWAGNDQNGVVSAALEEPAQCTVSSHIDDEQQVEYGGDSDASADVQLNGHNTLDSLRCSQVELTIDAHDASDQIQGHGGVTTQENVRNSSCSLPPIGASGRR